MLEILTPAFWALMIFGGLILNSEQIILALVVAIILIKTMKVNSKYLLKTWRLVSLAFEIKDSRECLGVAKWIICKNRKKAGSINKIDEMIEIFSFFLVDTWSKPLHDVWMGNWYHMKFIYLINIWRITIMCQALFPDDVRTDSEPDPVELNVVWRWKFNKYL